MIRGPLTSEIKNLDSPIRQYLDGYFKSGLRAVQRHYREAAPPLVVPATTQASASTIGTAADWLLRFMLHPQPDLTLAVRGAALCRMVRINALPALAELADGLGVPTTRSNAAKPFTGPTTGNTSEADLLARSCWALALLTEVYRAGPFGLVSSPLLELRLSTPTGAQLLDLANDVVLDQLAALRNVFEHTLMPALATRVGTWVLGPTFTGSALVKADADVIAAGLLLDLKTSGQKPSLPYKDVYQLIGYALLDFDDEYRLDAVALFGARYAHLTTWDLGDLLAQLAEQPVDLSAMRNEFRGLLLKYRGPINEGPAAPVPQKPVKIPYRPGSAKNPITITLDTFRRSRKHRG